MVGEHIRARRDGRWIHAIDCGDETVIQLSDDDPGPASVRRSYRPAFVAGAEAVEVVTHRERTFPPGEVVARAYSRIADPALAAMFRDSEAFAAWCATGRLPPAAANVATVAPALGSAPTPSAAPALGSTPTAPEPAAGPSRAKRARPARRTRKSRGTSRAAAKGRAAKRTAKRTKPAGKAKRSPTKGKAKVKRKRR